MFSWEIDNLCKNKNYQLSVEDYKKIIASPQLTHIRYDPYSDKFRIVTEDNYNWEFYVNKDN